MGRLPWRRLGNRAISNLLSFPPVFVEINTVDPCVCLAIKPSPQGIL